MNKNDKDSFSDKIPSAMDQFKEHFIMIKKAHDAFMSDQILSPIDQLKLDHNLLSSRSEGVGDKVHTMMKEMKKVIDDKSDRISRLESCFQRHVKPLNELSFTYCDNLEAKSLDEAASPIREMASYSSTSQLLNTPWEVVQRKISVASSHASFRSIRSFHGNVLPAYHLPYFYAFIVMLYVIMIN